jgi:hypothetical protein
MMMSRCGVDFVYNLVMFSIAEVKIFNLIKYLILNLISLLIFEIK